MWCGECAPLAAAADAPPPHPQQAQGVPTTGHRRGLLRPNSPLTTPGKHQREERSDLHAHGTQLASRPIAPARPRRAARGPVRLPSPSLSPPLSRSPPPPASLDSRRGYTHRDELRTPSVTVLLLRCRWREGGRGRCVPGACVKVGGKLNYDAVKICAPWVVIRHC